MKIIYNIILLALTALFLLAGCNYQSRVNKAKQVVLMDAQARHEIFLRELELYPCSNDSIVQTFNGQIDSVTLAEYLSNFKAHVLANKVSLDTLPKIIKDAYELGYKEASDKYLAVKVPKCNPKIIKITVTDKQKEKILADSLIARNSTVAVKNAEIFVLSNELDKAQQSSKANANKWIWGFIIAVILCVLSNVAWAYFKIFKL